MFNFGNSTVSVVVVVLSVVVLSDVVLFVVSSTTVSSLIKSSSVPVHPANTEQMINIAINNSFPIFILIASNLGTPKTVCQAPCI